MLTCVHRFVPNGHPAIQAKYTYSTLLPAFLFGCVVPFCLFMRTSPINFGLLGGNGNTLKLEMTTKLKDKQTSIATVRDLLRRFATFPAPLFSHCRLILKELGHEITLIYLKKLKYFLEVKKYLYWFDLSKYSSDVL
jgi:hypothetical protein